MPDGTVPSSTEALRAALSAARASLERQLLATRSDAAEDALRQVTSALHLLPAERVCDVPEIEWVDATHISATDAAPHALVRVERQNHNQTGQNTPGSLGTSRDGSSQDEPDPLIPDDLTRIRGVNDVLAKRLAALGIQRYAQIAAWQPDDVRVIADAMGLGRRFIAMGIVDQALTLDRARLAARDTPNATRPTATGLQSVAVWEPREGHVSAPHAADDARVSSVSAEASATLRPPTAWRPLDGETLKAVLSIIRTKRPMNVLVRLSEVAPSLTQPIYIATDHGLSAELPRWRTGVLVPLVEAGAAPDSTQRARASLAPTVDVDRGALMAGLPPHLQSSPPLQTGPSVEAAKAIAAFHAAMAASAPIGPTPQSVHEHAARRIDHLEAELEQWAQPSAHPPHVESAPRAGHAPRVAEPEIGQAAHHGFGSRDDVPEADVKIVVGARAKSPVLAPLPELPLKVRATRPTPTTPSSPGARPSAVWDGSTRRETPPGGGRVEEAAVVIVRRNTAEPHAAGLAFYAQAQSPRPDTGSIRRFMRALSGG